MVEANQHEDQPHLNVLQGDEGIDATPSLSTASSPSLADANHVSHMLFEPVHLMSTSTSTRRNSKRPEMSIMTQTGLGTNCHPTFQKSMTSFAPHDGGTTTNDERPTDVEPTGIFGVQQSGDGNTQLHNTLGFSAYPSPVSPVSMNDPQSLLLFGSNDSPSTQFEYEDIAPPPSPRPRHRQLTVTYDTFTNPTYEASSVNAALPSPPPDSVSYTTNPSDSIWTSSLLPATSALGLEAAPHSSLIPEPSGGLLDISRHYSFDILGPLDAGNPHAFEFAVLPPPLLESDSDSLMSWDTEPPLSPRQHSIPLPLSSDGLPEIDENIFPYIPSDEPPLFSSSEQAEDTFPSPLSPASSVDPYQSTLQDEIRLRKLLREAKQAARTAKQTELSLIQRLEALHLKGKEDPIVTSDSDIFPNRPSDFAADFAPYSDDKRGVSSIPSSPITPVPSLPPLTVASHNAGQSAGPASPTSSADREDLSGLVARWSHLRTEMHKLYKRESEWAKELQLLLLYGATPTPPPSPEGGLYDLVTAEDPAGSPKTHSSPKINFARGLQLSLLDAMNPEMTEDERKRGMRALASKMMLTRRDRRTRSVVNVSYASGSSQSAVAGDDASPLADVDYSGGSARRVRPGGGTDSGVIVRKKSSLSTTMSFEAENENDGMIIID